MAASLSSANAPVAANRPTHPPFSSVRSVVSSLGRRRTAAAPRRAASTRLDLSLALMAAGQHDEAAGIALEAITSGRIVPSNFWRAREVIQAVAESGLPQARELTEAFQETCAAAPAALP